MEEEYFHDNLRLESESQKGVTMDALSQQLNQKCTIAKKEGNFEAAKAYGTAAVLAMQAQVRRELDSMTNEQVFDELLKYYDIPEIEKEEMRQRVRQYWAAE